MDIGTVIMMMFPNAIPGEDFSFLEGFDENGNPTKDIGVWNEAKLGPRPASYAALQAWADANSLEALRSLKKKELELAFQGVWDAQYGTQVAVGLTLYFEFKTDPRTVIVTNARNNFINKMNTLNELGRNGRPPLTEANIAAIVW